MPVPKDPDQPTPVEKITITDWKKKSAKAAGYMYSTLDKSQKTHVKNNMSDVVVMWDTLRALHEQKTSSTRFNAYEDLFSIVKQDGESLSALITRVDAALHRVQQVRTESFTLADLDDELGCMTLIRALPADVYGAFRSSLLL
ncbi:hypothetical protein BOTBODRAFT_112821, partial [Botryobasidium botryosum FD-172 SS1]